MEKTPAGSHSTEKSKRSHLWLGLSLLAVLLRAFPAICYPIARDQATYLYIGQRLWDGKRLYLDLWDMKPPGIFWLYALFVKVFGTVMWSVGLVDILWLLVISWLIFKFAERHLGTAAATIAVVIHATWRAWSGYWDAAQTENFLILFVFAAYFLSSSKGKAWWLYESLSGILFAAAFWLKYNAVALVPMVVILPHLDFSPLADGARLPRFTLSRTDWMKRVGLWAAAFTACGAAVLGYIVRTGAWPAMREIQFEVLPRCNAMAIERYQHYWHMVFTQTGLYLGWWSMLVSMLAILVARRTSDHRAVLPVFSAAAMGLACAAMQARFPSYAFETCYPFLAMLWGYLLVKVFKGFRYVSRICWHRGWRLAAVLVWIIFANLVYIPLPSEAVQIRLNLSDLREWRSNRDIFYRNYPWARPISHYDGQMHVIQYLRQNSTRQDGVFVWGSEPLIYFLAHRDPPTRFISNLGLISLWGPAHWRQELVDSLEAAPPMYIVVDRDDQVPLTSFNFLDSEGYLHQRFPALLEFLTSRYHKVDDYKEFAIFRHD